MYLSNRPTGFRPSPSICPVSLLLFLLPQLSFSLLVVHPFCTSPSHMVTLDVSSLEVLKPDALLVLAVGLKLYYLEDIYFLRDNLPVRL